MLHTFIIGDLSWKYKRNFKAFPSCYLLVVLFGCYLWFQLRLNNTWVILVHKQLSVESVSLVWPSRDLERWQILLFWSFIKFWSAASKILCVTDGGMEGWTSADPRSRCRGQQCYWRLINQIMWQMVRETISPTGCFQMSHRPRGKAERQHLTEVLSFCSIREGSLWREEAKKTNISGRQKEEKNDGKYCSFPLDVIWSQPGDIALWNIAGAQN